MEFLNFAWGLKSRVHSSLCFVHEMTKTEVDQEAFSPQAMQVVKYKLKNFKGLYNTYQNRNNHMLLHF